MVQIIITILFSSVKFAMAFPLVILQFEFSFVETILWTNVGGMLGIYSFAFLSDRVISLWNRIFKKPRKEERPEKNPGEDYKNVRAKKTFTKRNRRIVHIKQKYGLIGIAVATPFLLSIPVGAFLVVRFYRASQKGFLYLIASNLLWSVIYTGFYIFWDGLFFNRL